FNVYIKINCLLISKSRIPKKIIITCSATLNQRTFEKVRRFTRFCAARNRFHGAYPSDRPIRLMCTIGYLFVDTGDVNIVNFKI
ncbi:MAG TPA: hypothetical protein VKP65_24655, partial [Rhodothermales bacterium]|nr:hypothetical protein [Rhodothermales bacterium]